jgi:hypothetical protein
VLAAYSLGDAIRTLLIFFAWIVFVGFGLWLLIAALRNRAVGVGIKILLVLLILIFPPVGFLGCLAFWLDTRRIRYPTVWESALRHGVVTGPAEVHRLDGSVVIVEPGQRLET